VLDWPLLTVQLGGGDRWVRQKKKVWPSTAFNPPLGGLEGSPPLIPSRFASEQLVEATLMAETSPKKRKRLNESSEQPNRKQKRVAENVSLPETIKVSSVIQPQLSPPVIGMLDSSELLMFSDLMISSYDPGTLHSRLDTVSVVHEARETELEKTTRWDGGQGFAPAFVCPPDGGIYWQRRSPEDSGAFSEALCRSFRPRNWPIASRRSSEARHTGDGAVAACARRGHGRMENKTGQA